MKDIIEKSFVIGEDAFHTQIIKRMYGNLLTDNMKSGHMVYLKSQPEQPFIYGSSSDDDFARKEGCFSDFIKIINTSDYFQVLFLVTTYQYYLSESVAGYTDLLKSDVSSFNNKNPHLDTFLKETNGWLVYHHQLENLYTMATGCDHPESQTFRKRINKKTNSSYAEPRSIEVFGASFYDIIKERMILKGTVKPNYHGAYLLFQHLIQ